MIIAKKKDYYDGVAGTTGIDKTIVYDRQITEFDGDKIPALFRKRDRWISDRGNPFYSLSHTSMKKKFHKQYPFDAYFIVGFCGKLYIGWKLYSIDKTTNRYDNVITTITYDLEHMKSLFEPKSWNSNFLDDYNFITNYDATELFRTLKTPCFVFDYDYGRTYVNTIRYHWETSYNKFIINPLLKDYEFPKLFDAFQAFQEIQMYLSGVLGSNEKDIIEVSDKDKIASHGFDKWSFRKEPQNKK